VPVRSKIKTPLALRALRSVFSISEVRYLKILPYRLTRWPDEPVNARRNRYACTTAHNACPAAEDRPHVTAEQVDKAIAALDALAAKQSAVPGFALAVVARNSKASGTL